MHYDVKNCDRTDNRRQQDGNCPKYLLDHPFIFVSDIVQTMNVVFVDEIVKKHRTLVQNVVAVDENVFWKSFCTHFIYIDFYNDQIWSRKMTTLIDAYSEKQYF